MERPESLSDPRQGTFLVIALVAYILITVVGIFWMVRDMPPRIAEFATQLDYLFFFILFVTGVTFVGAHLYLIIAIWRFRYRRGERGKYFGFTLRELRPLFIPLLLLFLLDLIFDLWADKLYLYALTKFPEDAFVVEVTGEQFAWSIRYPGKDGKFGRTDPRFISDLNPLGIDPDDKNGWDDIVFPAGEGELHLPVHRPVLFLVRSKDVLHSFFVPFARLKIDAVPGMTTRVWFTPTETGEFEFACAELCGLGHYKMRGVLVIERMEEVKAWLEEQATFGEMLP